MAEHIKGCDCGAHVPQRVIDAAKEASAKVANGTYRSLDLAELSDEDFDRWCADRSCLGEYDGFTISGLSKDKRLRALTSRPSPA